MKTHKIPQSDKIALPELQKLRCQIVYQDYILALESEKLAAANQEIAKLKIKSLTSDLTNTIDNTCRELGVSINDYELDISSYTLQKKIKS